MNQLKLSLCALCLVLPMLVSAQPADTSDADKTLSPYFLIKSDDPTVDRLPLLSTKADVSIAGVIADVKVKQVYKNDGKKPIEAVYTFPASTRAAVHAMKMTIGDRTIVAEIREREKARQEYEQAKHEGKTASLLEQERPNVFQMNVANIMPGDFITVEMSYTELLVPAEGVYEFAYPTVVGPRYSNIPEKQAKQLDQWVKSPYTHEGEAPSYEFGMNVRLAAGLPIQEISCPSHKTSVKYEGLDDATIALDPSEKQGGNRDFILRYRLAGGKIQSGLLLFQGKDENFFLAMIQPPKRVDASAIPPREYIFIVDVSGSMHGFPLDISKTLLRNLLTNLRPSDYFNVELFSGVSAVMAEKSVPVNAQNIEDAIAFINKEQGSGGTEVLPALQRALALPRTEGVSRTIVIATDGYVSVETEAFDLIRKNLGKANMFAFGIGSSVNRFIIEGMAHVGMGEPFVIDKPEAAAAQAEKFRKYIETPVLTGIDVAYNGFEVYDVEPKTIPDVLAERPIIIFGKWRGQPSGSIVVTGLGGAGKYRQALALDGANPSDDNSALRYLWARHMVQILADYNNLAEDPGRVKEITGLGLKYSLLTQYTSFVAIDKKVRNVGGKQEVVEQALPLPQGVSDLAVGGGAATGFNGMGKSLAPAGGVGYRSSVTAERVITAEDFKRLPVGPLSNFVPFPSNQPGSVQVGKTQVKGGLSEQAVKDAVEKKLADIKADYAAALASQPSLKGKMVIEFVVKADGTVRGVKVTTNQLTTDLQKKLVKYFEQFAFPKPAGGEATVTVTLNFKP